MCQYFPGDKEHPARGISNAPIWGHLGLQRWVLKRFHAIYPQFINFSQDDFVIMNTSFFQKKYHLGSEKKNPNNIPGRYDLPPPFSFPPEIRCDISIPLYSHCWFAPSWGNKQDSCLPQRVSLDIRPAALYGDQEIQKGCGRWMFCSIPRALKCKRKWMLNTRENKNTFIILFSWLHFYTYWNCIVYIHFIRNIKVVKYITHKD